MEFVTEVGQLLQFGGLALAVGLLMQFLGKPIIQRRYRIDVLGDKTPPEVKANYRVVMNVTSGVLGVGLALIALAVTGNVANQDILMGVLNGVAGGFLATGGYEALGNIAGKVFDKGT